MEATSSATVRVHSDGKATICVGTHSHGQGHEITYAAIAADRMGIPIDDIEVIEGDTGRVQFGNGTWGSRSASVGGAAVYLAAEQVLTKARRIAAYVLEAEEADLSYENWSFSVRNTNRKVSFGEIAKIAYDGGDLPKREGFEPGLETTIFHDPPDLNDPEAMHLAVVLVDRTTGDVRASGVLHGGRLRCGDQPHDRRRPGSRRACSRHRPGDDGARCLRSEIRPASDWVANGLRNSTSGRSTVVQTNLHETPAPSNPLGVKGGSETGAIGPPAAIANAVVDAVAHLGVHHVELPLSPQSIWRSLQAAKSKN